MRRVDAISASSAPGNPGAGQAAQKAFLAYLAVEIAKFRAGFRGAVKYFLAALFRGDQPKFQKFAQGIVDRMAVFDIQHETDIRQPLFPVAVIDVMQGQDFKRAQFRHTGRVHAFLHPAAEGVIGDDQAVFEFRGFPALTLGQMTGGYDTSTVRFAHQDIPANRL